MMRTASQSHHLEERKKLINDMLEQLIDNRTKSTNTLYQAARYALLGEGKRLRPLLTVITAEVFGVEAKSALLPACAIEMVHAYSLIHDDLPAMDDDDWRRGKPTVHKAFSEAIAILAGDMLLTQAFEVLSQVPNLPQDRKLKLIEILAKRSGGEGMIAGQVMDVESQGHHLSLDAVKQMHICKTAALISAAIEFGGVIAGISDEEIKVLKSFGMTIGLAFQIIDDILDSKEEGSIDRPLASFDNDKGKATYVTLNSVDQAFIEAKDLLDQAQRLLDCFSQDTTALRQLTNSLVHRKL